MPSARREGIAKRIEPACRAFGFIRAARQTVATSQGSVQAADTGLQKVASHSIQASKSGRPRALPPTETDRRIRAGSFRMEGGAQSSQPRPLPLGGRFEDSQAVIGTMRGQDQTGSCAKPNCLCSGLSVRVKGWVAKAVSVASFWIRRKYEFIYEDPASSMRMRLSARGAQEFVCSV